jgi:hypothetical protein
MSYNGIDYQLAPPPKKSTQCIITSNTHIQRPFHSRAHQNRPYFFIQPVVQVFATSADFTQRHARPAHQPLPVHADTDPWGIRLQQNATTPPPGTNILVEKKQAYEPHGYHMELRAGTLDHPSITTDAIASGSGEPIMNVLQLQLHGSHTMSSHPSSPHHRRQYQQHNNSSWHSTIHHQPHKYAHSKTVNVISYINWRKYSHKTQHVLHHTHKIPRSHHQLPQQSQLPGMHFRGCRPCTILNREWCPKTTHCHRCEPRLRHLRGCHLPRLRF